MDERLENIQSSKYIIYSHLVMYVAIAVYFISAYVREKGGSPVLSIVITVGFALMALIEFLSLRGKKILLFLPFAVCFSYVFCGYGRSIRTDFPYSNAIICNRNPVIPSI